MKNHCYQQFDLAAKFAIIMDFDNHGVTNMLHHVAKSGHRDLVDFFISKGANWWNEGLFGAAQGGHRDLVDFFILKGAHHWNAAIEHSARGGHRNLVDFFISKAIDAGIDINWNWAIWGAAQYKDSTVCRTLVDSIILKCKDDGHAVDMDWGLEGAARGGHRDLIDYFISKGAQDWYWGAEGARIGGHQDLIEFFHAKIKSKKDTFVNKVCL